MRYLYYLRAIWTEFRDDWEIKQKMQFISKMNDISALTEEKIKIMKLTLMPEPWQLCKLKN